MAGAALRGGFGAVRLDDAGTGGAESSARVEAALKGAVASDGGNGEDIAAEEGPAIAVDGDLRPKAMSMTAATASPADAASATATTMLRCDTTALAARVEGGVGVGSHGRSSDAFGSTSRSRDGGVKS